MANSKRVGARGTIDSPLVIILEAPGAEELKYGSPVCGPSGDLLDKSVPPSFDYDEAFVINAMQCRPPKTKDQNKDKNFKARACGACRQRVLSQVFRYPRKAILAMGAWSNSSLLADYNFKITQRRGTPYVVKNPETGEGVTVIPTVHPAFLLRGAGNPKVFRDDIALAHSIAFADDGVGSIAVRSMLWKDPTYRTLETVQDLAEYVQHLGEIATRWPWSPLAVTSDIETTGFNPWVDWIRGIGFYIGDGTDESRIVPKQALKDKAFCYYLRRFLVDHRFKFVWQNGKFDELFLKEEGLILDRESICHEDTLLLSYSLSEATKDHDLDEQAKNVLGAPDHKWITKKWGKNADDFYRNCPDHILFDYQAKDLKKTHLLYEHNRPLVAADDNLEKLYTQTLIPSSHLLSRVERYGIAIDHDFVRINRFGATKEDVERRLILPEDLEKELGLENELLIIKKELAELVGRNVNPNSPAEVSELLYDEYKLRINGKRPDGTAKEILEKLPPHPAVKMIRKYRSVVKMLGTYVTAIEEQHINGIIHTTFNLHVTTTGRLSSNHPNIQNIPRDARFRRMYRARPGYILLESDYNSAELRMLACLSGDEFLTGVFLDDKRNLHDEVSVAMYGEDWTPDQRIRAKAINFGIPYGRDAYSIALEFGISPDEAQRLINAWFARAPRAKKFLDSSASAAAAGRTLITVFGRKRRPGVVSPERLNGLQNEFKNFHMQSPISDFTMHSGIEYADEIERYDSHIVNLIHDASLNEVPDDPEAIIAVAKIVQDTMEDVPRRWIDTPIQFKTDLKIGTWWGMGGSFNKWRAKYELERPKIFAVPQLQPQAQA